MSYRNFTVQELKCPCCGRLNMDADFMNKMDLARDFSNTSYVPTSAYRCRIHNKAIEASETSSHPLGLAMDISATTSSKRFKILAGLIKAGFTRIGIRKDFIHVDDDPEKDQIVMWLY